MLAAIAIVLGLTLTSSSPPKLLTAEGVNVVRGGFRLEASGLAITPQGGLIAMSQAGLLAIRPITSNGTPNGKPVVVAANENVGLSWLSFSVVAPDRIIGIWRYNSGSDRSTVRLAVWDLQGNMKAGPIVVAKVDNDGPFSRVAANPATGQAFVVTTAASRCKGDTCRIIFQTIDAKAKLGKRVMVDASIDSYVPAAVIDPQTGRGIVTFDKKRAGEGPYSKQVFTVDFGGKDGLKVQLLPSINGRVIAAGLGRFVFREGTSFGKGDDEGIAGPYEIVQRAAKTPTHVLAKTKLPGNDGKPPLAAFVGQKLAILTQPDLKTLDGLVISSSGKITSAPSNLLSARNYGSGFWYSSFFQSASQNTSLIIAYFDGTESKDSRIAVKVWQP